MENIFTVEAIRETKTYRELVSKKQQAKIDILEQRIVRSRITNAFNVWKNTGVIPNTVKYSELSVVNDLILNRYETR